ncbi:restriction endonuclease subunit S [Escherichia fergusonii]|uniref:restriction endonuclease subunit S n=1 Tax=Escherichia fergusonii TaxID=564 RepID=UPI001C9B22C2|nr:restriction endonuclease subunit S [Escherichia fergusonii]MBY7447181.1 restriction endonuclease subunit S [Escherichia fergusonii]MBY7557561.1 restriction endonuclease subunit S [Escherichia fergusonii]MCH5364878.1 restriction endonuclease subunit S [Escherichia fergusonii]MCP9673154.1 restriction endonuclease subunit S [Escherichia fergusonii]
MSEMSYLEKLLDGVEVEWLPLGEVSALRRGRVMSKGYLTENFGPYPVYSSQTANNGKIGSINTFDFDGEYISWTTDGANAGTVFYRTGKFSITNVCGLITLKSKCPLIYKFLFYWLTIEAKKHVYSGMGNPKLMSHQVENIPVPIPCPDNPEKSLAIQSEIVRILDKFTALTSELTAELTAELNMRKKQYNYYRDQLLSFKEGEVKWKTLGEITEINTGQKPSEILDKAATFDYINAGTSRSGYTTMSNCDGDTVTTPSRGQGGIGFVGYQKTPFWLGPLCYKIKSLNNEILINKFLFYTLQSRNRILLSLKKEGGVPAVNKIDLAKLIIPLPSLDEQKRIVSLIDKFDTLTNSITEGLPREIELRQKQYEYYRDLLFSFPKPETVSN